MAENVTSVGVDVMIGCEATARGAIEAGVRLAVGYPGTPATPAMEYLIARKGGDLRAEWSVNEKVALEIAVGHSWAGQRTFTALKMSGLNVATDSLLSLATSGVRGGLVIMVGDDPGVYYGMVEQDSRLIARLAMLPMIEPSTPDEARMMTRDAFDVSERTEAPVMIRQTTTTAFCFGKVNKESPWRSTRKTTLPNDLSRYTKAGSAACRRQHSDALERLRKAGRELDGFNVLTEGSGRLGIIAAGSVMSYVEDSLSLMADIKPHVLKVAVVNPLPSEKIVALLEKCDRVLVVEELEPVIEERVRALAQGFGRRIDILGKGVIPRVGDLDPDVVDAAISRLADRIPRTLPEPLDLSGFAPRKSSFCPGCPHRSTYTALEMAIKDAGFKKEEVMITGDIGCTILGMDKPFSLCRTELVMGASIAMAQGFFYAGVETPVIATIGDSTFFHSGIPALINASAMNVNLTVIVLDNDYAAMTGFQPTVNTSRSRPDATPVKIPIPELVKAVKVRSIDGGTPYFTKRLAKMITKALKNKGVNVIVAQAPCAVKRYFPAVIPCSVRAAKCKGIESCGFACLAKSGCTAIEKDVAADKAFINEVRCIGCGLCAELCPTGAIKRNVGLLRRFQ